MPEKPVTPNIHKRLSNGISIPHTSHSIFVCIWDDWAHKRKSIMNGFVVSIRQSWVRASTLFAYATYIYTVWYAALSSTIFGRVWLKEACCAILVLSSPVRPAHNSDIHLSLAGVWTFAWAYIIMPKSLAFFLLLSVCSTWLQYVSRQHIQHIACSTFAACVCSHQWILFRSGKHIPIDRQFVIMFVIMLLGVGRCVEKIAKNSFRSEHTMKT